MAKPYNAKLKFCFLGSDNAGALPLATLRGNNSLDLLTQILTLTRFSVSKFKKEVKKVMKNQKQNNKTNNNTKNCGSKNCGSKNKMNNKQNENHENQD